MSPPVNGPAADSGGRASARSTSGGQSFEEWVHASGPRLKRLAYLLTGDLHEAEDLLQAAYAKVYPRWDRISTYDAPEAYMHRVMVNQRTSWWRRNKGREWSTDEIPETPWRRGTAGEAAMAESVIESQALLGALRGLPKRQRAAVVLRHWCDLSEAETADAMKCSVGTVKSSTARGLANLRTALAVPDPHDTPSPTRGSAAKGDHR